MAASACPWPRRGSRWIRQRSVPLVYTRQRSPLLGSLVARIALIGDLGGLGDLSLGELSLGTKGSKPFCQDRVDGIGHSDRYGGTGGFMQRVPWFGLSRVQARAARYGSSWGCARPHRVRAIARGFSGERVKSCRASSDYNNGRSPDLGVPEGLLGEMKTLPGERPAFHSWATRWLVEVSRSLAHRQAARRLREGTHDAETRRPIRTANSLEPLPDGAVSGELVCGREPFPRPFLARSPRSGASASVS